MSVFANKMTSFLILLLRTSLNFGQALKDPIELNQ